MADSRFFSVGGPFKLAELAQISGAVIERDLSHDMKFLDILPLSTAKKNNASCFNNRRYFKDFQSSNAGAIILDPSFISQAPSEASLLTSRNPYLAYAKLTHAFYPEKIFQENIHSGAFVDPSAKIGKSVMIDAGVIIKENVEIGDYCSISGNTFIGAGVKIGDNNIIGSNISITHCLMGSFNILHAGARIGQDGFGYAPNIPTHEKVLQLGRVIIGNDVEIGANTSIDRGSGPDTVIGDGTKIDNLVHIAHNVQIGSGCFITGQNGIAGSARIGNHVAFGGQVGVSGHVSIGDNVQVAAQSGVSTDIKAGMTVAGTPAQSAREHWTGLALLRKLVKQRKN